MKSESCRRLCNSVGDVVLEVIKMSVTDYKHQDVTIICQNGVLKSNSFLLSSVFPIFEEALKHHVQDEEAIVSMPDMNINNLNSFLQHLAQEKILTNTDSYISEELSRRRTHDRETESGFDKIQRNHILDTQYQELKFVEKILKKHDDDFKKEEDYDEEFMEPLLEDENPGDYDDDYEDVQKISLIKTKVKKKSKKIHQCSLCDYNSHSSNQLKRHSLTHKELSSGAVYHNCNICEYKTHMKCNLKRHMKRHSNISTEYQVPKDSLLQCSYCGKEIRADKMKYHLRYYHCERPYQKLTTCTICGKEVQHISNHMKTHSDKEPCPVCGQLMKDIKRHMELMHTSKDEMKSQCEDCDKSFPYKYMLDKHRMNVHLKTRPYTCRYGCELSYNDSSNRNAHERRRHGQIYSSLKTEVSSSL